jgi:hypothetical protein
VKSIHIIAIVQAIYFGLTGLWRFICSTPSRR